MTSPDWHYDELQQIGVDYTDTDEVKKYDDRMRRLRDIDAEIDALIAATSPTAGSVVLEIGTGTGEFAIALAGIAQRVCAVDVSPVMLAYARQKAAARRVTNIEFHHAGFLSFHGAAEQFDIVFSQLALHHLPDFWKAAALARISKLLKKGGVFYLKDVVYPSDIEDYDAYFEGVIQGYENAAGAEFTREIIAHIKKEYSTLDWILAGLLQRAGLAIVESHLENGFIATYRCVKQSPPPPLPGARVSSCPPP